MIAQNSSSSRTSSIAYAERTTHQLNLRQPISTAESTLSQVHTGTHLNILVRRPVQDEMALPRYLGEQTREPDRLLHNLLEPTALLHLDVRRTPQERPFQPAQQLREHLVEK